jgi:hypothetical protein
MIRDSLHFFARRVLRTKRMDASDLRTLQRIIFSDGVTSRDEVEVLLRLARGIEDAHPAWADFVVTAIVDFAVWGARPTGYVTPDMARWLATALSEGGVSRLGRRIAREIATEAHNVDPRLLDLGRRRWMPRLSWLGLSFPLQIGFGRPPRPLMPC